jgi:hypothetical protein
MNKYERLFRLYKIGFNSFIKEDMYYFYCDNFAYQYEINKYVEIYAIKQEMSIIDVLNTEAMLAYYREFKQRQAKSIVEQLDLKSKKIVTKYFR